MNNRELGKRIPLEGTKNTRDLGGYPTKDGRTIAYKRLIRSDCLANITKKDEDILLHDLHVLYEVDMRGKHEILTRPNVKLENVTFLHLPIQEEEKREEDYNPHTNILVEDKALQHTIDYLFRMDFKGDITIAFEKVYRNMLRPFGKSAYEKFIRLCIKNKEGAILFHCADGKDRSGLAAAILLLSLGVEKEIVIQDYLKTNENTIDKARKREEYLRNVAHIQDETIINSIKAVAGVRRNWIEAAFDEMEKQAGTIDNFINQELHLSEEDLEELRNNYLI